VTDSTDIKVLGDGALSADCFAFACRTMGGALDPRLLLFRAEAIHWILSKTPFTR
jgi:hypothetical protein